MRWMESSAGLAGRAKNLEEAGKRKEMGTYLGQRNGSQSCSRFAGRQEGSQARQGRQAEGGSSPRLRGQFPVGRLVMQTYATILRCKCNN